MFFWSNSKLNEKLKEKDEEINTLHLAIEELNQEHAEKLKYDAKELKKLKKESNSKSTEIEKLNRKLDTKTKKLKAITDELEKITSADALTGAYNRRYFYDVAESIISLIKREKQHLSLARIYIDQFKDVKADEVLQTLVHEVSKHTRESDVFVRFGDKEFVILFPNTSAEHAVVISEKLREAIESCCTANNVKFTISVGVSEFIHDKDNIDMTLKRAYQALNEAKGSAKNRVIAENI